MTNKITLPQIALITPLKDERENIDKFFNALSGQSYKINSLIILENDSVDGSKEYLNSFKEIPNVTFFETLNISFENKAYDIEFKYAEIVSKGLTYLKTLPHYDELTYIGILDSDCFPESDYYEKLHSFLQDNVDVGITSGIIFTEEGKQHIANTNWVRGGCRIWRKECLEATGFPIAPSPDAITVAMANKLGWKAKTDKTAKVFSREVNERLLNFKNFGKRAYFRGNTPIFAILKTIHFCVFKLKFKMGIDFFNGYFFEYRKNKPRIEDLEIREYYRNYLLNKLKEKLHL